MVLFPPTFYFVFYISNLLSYIHSYELARPIMGTIFLVNWVMNKRVAMASNGMHCMVGLYLYSCLLLVSGCWVDSLIRSYDQQHKSVHKLPQL